MANETGQDKIGRMTGALVSVYVLLLFFAIYGSYQFTDWNNKDALKNFAAVATVCIAAASAVMGVVINFIGLQKNQQSARTLEELKTDLQVKVLSQKIWTDLRFEHEKMRATAELTAYAKLWTSTDYAYRLLAKLETSSWKPEDKQLMDNSLLEAHAQLVYTRNSSHQDLWERVRQRARYISEEAAKVSVQAQPDLWKRTIADFDRLCQDFKEIANAEIHRPPPVPEKTS